MQWQDDSDAASKLTYYEQSSVASIQGEYLETFLDAQVMVTISHDLTKLKTFVLEATAPVFLWIFTSMVSVRVIRKPGTTVANQAQ